MISSCTSSLFKTHIIISTFNHCQFPHTLIPYAGRSMQLVFFKNKTPKLTVTQEVNHAIRATSSFGKELCPWQPHPQTVNGGTRSDFISKLSNKC